jgi:hypothetical protein
MTVTLEAPVTNISLMALMPGMIQSCNVLEPGEDAPITIGEDDIYTPVAPGVTYESLPEVTIIDTSPDQIIGCIIDTFDDPQGRLDALFPEAIDGDGVIERSTNDIWVYDGAVWNNVGPNPGPTIVDTTIIPPWNEIVRYEARIRTFLQAQALPYALEQSIEVDPIAIKIKVITRVINFISVPASAFALAAENPSVSTPPSPPTPGAEVIINASYSQRSVYFENTPATIGGMTNGITDETTETGTDSHSDADGAWVQMDFGSQTVFSKVVVGCDFNGTLAGGWNKFFTENCDIIGSNDQSNWTVLANTGTFTQPLQEYSITNASYRYVRIRKNDNFLAVTEFYALAGSRTISVQPLSIQLAPIAPLSAGRSKTVAKVSSVTFTISAFSPVAGSGSSVMVDNLDISIIIGDVKVFIREPGFEIAPINFGLSDQPTGISLGSFPLATS